MKNESNTSTAGPTPEQLEQLPPMERSVWMLSAYEGFSEAEISEITGLSIAEARQTLRAANRKMQSRKPLVVAMFPSSAFLMRSAAAVALLGLLGWWWLKPGSSHTAITQPETASLQPATPQSTTPAAPAAPKAAVFTNKNNQPAPTVAQQASKRHENILPAPQHPEPAAPTGASPQLVAIPTLPAIQRLAPVGPLETGILTPTQSTTPEYVVALGTNPETATRELTTVTSTVRKLRQVLTPRSFANPDDEIVVSLQLPSVVFSLSK